jgi:ribonuclease VapC
VKIVVDTSALIALIAGEVERDLIEDALLASSPVISAGTLIEALRVVQLNFGSTTLEKVHSLLAIYRIEVIPVDLDQVRAAQEGMLRFGKGRGAAPAVLNFGDLFAYALAKSLPAPLLYKGSDFAQTDVVAAL